MRCQADYAHSYLLDWGLGCGCLLRMSIPLEISKTWRSHMLPVTEIYLFLFVCFQRVGVSGVGKTRSPLWRIGAGIKKMRGLEIFKLLFRLAKLVYQNRLRRKSLRAKVSHNKYCAFGWSFLCAVFLGHMVWKARQKETQNFSSGIIKKLIKEEVFSKYGSGLCI